MASYFEELYGINPVTFNQTHLNANRLDFKDFMFGSSKLLEDKHQYVDYHIVNTLLPTIFDNETTLAYTNNSDSVEFISIFDSSDSINPNNLIPFSYSIALPGKTTPINIPQNKGYFMKKR